MKRHLIPVLALGTLFHAACSNDALGPGNATDDERDAVLAELDASGFLDEDLGENGIPTAAAANAMVLDEATDAAPQNWGRRGRHPVGRRVTVQIVDNIATVTKEIDFEGVFMVRDPQTLEISTQDIAHTMIQSAVLERLPQEEVTDSGRRRHWKLLELSPQEWVMTEADKATMHINSIRILVDGDEVAVVDDPALLYDVTGRIPRLHRGAEVTVYANVTNDVVDGGTYVYLHLFHARVDFRGWRRIAMSPVEGEENLYMASWMAHQSGRNRIMVDALDAASFEVGAADTYRAHLVGIPYRIEDDLSN